MKHILILALTVCVGMFASCTGRPPTPVDAAAPKAKVADLSSPELTLRTFWSAIKTGDTNAALACTIPQRIRQGHHGRDVYKLVSEYKTMETNTFRFIGGAGASCSIESPNHCMDYDMEKNEKGEWMIISIHP